MEFKTDFKYTNRDGKAEYVWLKYGSILSGKEILDVGADECHLKEHLDDKAKYLGVGLGGKPDREVDLEKGELPFEDGSFDCVLCLDVLEHLESIHDIFDELCRVSRQYLILSLPNPWANFWKVLRRGDFHKEDMLKFYGLPLEKPLDRHRWFFSTEDAEKFVIYRAGKNGMRIVQIDNDVIGGEGRGMRRMIRIIARSILFNREINVKNLYAGTLWVVLEKMGEE